MAVLGIQELTAIIYSFTGPIMRVGTLVRDATRIHAQILCGSPLKEHRGGNSTFQPMRWHRTDVVKHIVFELLDPELLADLSYRGIKRTRKYI